MYDDEKYKQVTQVVVVISVMTDIVEKQEVLAEDMLINTHLF